MKLQLLNNLCLLFNLDVVGDVNVSSYDIFLFKLFKFELFEFDVVDEIFDKKILY